MRVAAQSRPNIFGYHDYRSFLQDWVVYLKGVQKGFSLRKLSQSSGVSVTYLSLVLSSQRVLSVRHASSVAKNLTLSTSEQSYFKQLVKLSESTSQVDRVAAYKQIKRFNHYAESNGKEIETFQYMSKWYYVAIRELVARPDFSADPTWIQEQLVHSVPVSEIDKAMQFLLTYGYLEKDAKGKIRQTARDVSCLSGVYNLSLNQFHKQVIELGLEAMDRVHRDRRNFSGFTFLLNEKYYSDVEKIFANARTQLQELEKRGLSEGGEKSVYHTEMMAFPMTGRKK